MLKKMHESLSYSRNVITRDFLITSLLFLLAFTLLHWGSRFTNWRRRRRRPAQNIQNSGRAYSYASFDSRAASCKNGGSSAALSSVSTLQGDPPLPIPLSPNLAKGEQSQLLVKTRNDQHDHQKLPLTQTVKAWLIYQPRPIPVLNKTLPSNRTTIVVLIFIGIELFYTIYNVRFSVSTLFVFADRASVVFMINLPLLYLLAAKNQPLKLLTGYSYESLNIFHRRLGEFMCLLALLHSVGMFGAWYTVLRPAGLTLGNYLLHKIILLGIAAFFAYELLYFTSLGSFRQKWYELFLATHVFLQITALILLWFHHRNSRIPVGIALGVFLLDRLIYRMVLKKSAVRASLEVKDKSTVVVRARISKSEKQRKWTSAISSNIESGWDPTDHVFLTVPSLSRKHIVQAHPFTIASKAPSFSDSRYNLELIIRAQDGFTNDLLNLAQSHNEAEIQIDGPYGSHSAMHMLQDCDAAVIIAGGSGIAVAWPLARSIVNPNTLDDPESATLPAFSSPPKLLFIWIVREPSHLTWLNPGSLDELHSHGADVVIPKPTSSHGHPDIAGIVASWLADYGDDPANARKIGVVCSGPDGMNRTVRNFCASLVSQGHDLTVEIEKFGW